MSGIIYPAMTVSKRNLLIIDLNLDIMYYFIIKPQMNTDNEKRYVIQDSRYRIIKHHLVFCILYQYLSAFICGSIPDLFYF